MSTSRIQHLILDRDGVLCAEQDGRFLRSPGDWQWQPGAREGIERAASYGVRLSVATNQSAVSRGQVDIEELEALHAWLLDQLQQMGARPIGVFACPHDKTDGCDCRKPEPGLLHDAIARSGIPVRRTAMVGDDLRDIQAARAAGVRPVLVRTGKGQSVEPLLDPSTSVYDDLDDAVQGLLDRPSHVRAHFE